MVRAVACFTILLGLYFHEAAAFLTNRRTPTHHVAVNKLVSSKDTHDCKDYMATNGCAWTKDWSCEGQLHGLNGSAGADDSTGYECCCKQGRWKQDVDYKKYLENACNKYMATKGCGWTTDWSCAEQSFGLKGFAGEDGTIGNECCCKQGRWKQEALANYQKKVEEWKATTAAAKPVMRVHGEKKFGSKFSPVRFSAFSRFNVNVDAAAMNGGDENLFDGVWNKVPQKEWESLCGSGKLLPQLYLLGAPKGSTTTLAHELMHAGVECVHDQESDKEFHFFDGMMDWSFKGEDAFQQQKKLWLEWMPPCPSSLPNASRHLLADFTPDYLRMVPLPRKVGRFGTFPPWQNLELGEIPHGSSHVVSLPPLMVHLYGVEASRRLQFVVLLRNPLSRMQSAWYHAQSFNFTNECVDCRAPSFQASVDEHMDRFKERSEKTYSDWLWTGMYGYHLDAWMEYFDPWQFFIIPYAYVRGDDKDEVCKRLTQHLNFDMDCDSQGAPLTHEWSHPHPPLDEDLSQESRTKFDHMMLWHKQNLVGVLAGAHKHGMVLASYRGNQSDKDSIMTWLENGW